MQVPPFKQIKSKHGSGTAKRFIYFIKKVKQYIKHERCDLLHFHIEYFLMMFNVFRNVLKHSASVSSDQVIRTLSQL